MAQHRGRSVRLWLPLLPAAAAAHALRSVKRHFAELHAAPEPDRVGSPPPSEAPALDPSAMHAALRRLAEQLDDNDLAAGDHFDRLRPVLVRRLDTNALQAMATAIAELDFAVARQWLDSALDETAGESAS